MINWIKDTIRSRRRLLAIGSLGAIGFLPTGRFLTQCAPPAPLTCDQKPSSVECQHPYVQVSPNGTSASAYAGTQFLKEIHQTLLRVELVCAGNNTWSRGPWTNADGVATNTTEAYWSCYPRQAVAVSYTTQHS